MEKPAGIVEELLGRVEGYGKTSLELAKLKAVKKLIPVATSAASQLVVISAFSLFALLFNIGIAMWLGDILGKGDVVHQPAHQAAARDAHYRGVEGEQWHHNEQGNDPRHHQKFHRWQAHGT